MLSEECIQAAINKLVAEGFLKHKKPAIEIRVDEKDFEVTLEEINNSVYKKPLILIPKSSEINE